MSVSSDCMVHRAGGRPWSAGTMLPAPHGDLPTLSIRHLPEILNPNHSAEMHMTTHSTHSSIAGSGRSCCSHASPHGSEESDATASTASSVDEAATVGSALRSDGGPRQQGRSVEDRQDAVRNPMKDMRGGCRSEHTALSAGSGRRERLARLAGPPVQRPACLASRFPTASFRPAEYCCQAPHDTTSRKFACVSPLHSGLLGTFNYRIIHDNMHGVSSGSRFNGVGRCSGGPRKLNSGCSSKRLRLPSAPFGQSPAAAHLQVCSSPSTHATRVFAASHVLHTVIER